jgi:hypothetical protein
MSKTKEQILIHHLKGAEIGGSNALNVLEAMEEYRNQGAPEKAIAVIRMIYDQSLDNPKALTGMFGIAVITEVKNIIETLDK